MYTIPWFVKVRMYVRRRHCLAKMAMILEYSDYHLAEFKALLHYRPDSQRNIISMPKEAGTIPYLIKY